MKILQRLGILFGLIAFAAHAQTTITATVPNYANGVAVITFNSGGAASPFPRSVQGAIDSSGHFSLDGWNNTTGQYSPSTTTANICAGSAPSICYQTTFRATGVNQDITALLANAPVPPSTSGAVTSVVPGTNVTCSPNVAGSCAGAVTINASASGGMTYPPGNGIPTVNTAGTAWSVTYPQVPVENYSAVVYSTKAAAISGTDSTTPIQNCLNAVAALGAGQCLLQTGFYRVTAALSITASNVGIRGQGPFASHIITTSSSADIIDLAGANISTQIEGNTLDAFDVERSVAPTTGSKGISFNYVGNPGMRNIVSQDSGSDFYFHGTGNSSIGGITTDLALFGKNGVTESAGTYQGFWLDSADGICNCSLQMQDVGASAASIPGGVTFIFRLIKGTAINDLVSDNSGSGGMSYGEYIQYTGSGAADTASDLHFTQEINDQCAVTCIYVTGIPATGIAGGAVEFNGGYSETPTGTEAVDIESSFGVSISNMSALANTGTQMILANNSSGLKFVNDQLLNVPNGASGIVLTSTTNSIAAANTIQGLATANALINLDAASLHNTVSANSLSGTATYGIYLGGSAGFIPFTAGLDTNSYGTSVTYGAYCAGVTGDCPSLTLSPGSMHWLTAGQDEWDVFTNGATGLNSYEWFNPTANLAPFRLFAHAGVAYATTFALGSYCWNADANYADFAPDTCVSRDAAGVIDLGNGTQGNKTARVQAGSFTPTTYTVSTLPSAATWGAGATVVVSDATTFTPGTCTGGGSDYMIAVSNGTTWSCH